MEVTRDTFREASPEAQNLILFDSIQNVSSKLDKFHGSCTNKHEDIDRRILRSGRANKAISGASGLFGGFLAVIFQKFFTQ